MTIDVGIAEVSVSSATLHVTFGDGVDGRFNRFWLHHNRGSERDQESLFRATSAADAPDDLSIRSAAHTADRVSVTFSDGSESAFGAAWLREHLPGDDDPGCATPWGASERPTEFEFGDLRPGSADHLALLEAIARSGVALVHGVDVERTEELAALAGPIRETDFGRVFDIVTEPDPFTPSQSSAALDPHTDDPYRYTPAGISVLHCVEPAAGGGGESIVVDGFAVAEMMRAADPAAFELLATVRVPFVHRREDSVEQGADVHLRATASVIALDPPSDPNGRLAGIRFHERAMAAPRLDADIADAYYRALRTFARAVRSPDHAWSGALGEGDALVYDNQRVLHGRREFTGASRRHLRLCTVDRDQAHSRLRRLREVHGTGTESARLPAGNLA